MFLAEDAGAPGSETSTSFVPHVERRALCTWHGYGRVMPATTTRSNLSSDKGVSDANANYRDAGNHGAQLGARLRRLSWRRMDILRHGYGTRSQGMAGAGVAFPLGPLVAGDESRPVWRSRNPAWISASGCSIRTGSTRSRGTRRGIPSTFGLAPGTVKSRSTLFPIPHLGVARRFGAGGMLGLAIYGNGGMNTNYDARTFGFAPTGVNLSQIFVAPDRRRQAEPQPRHRRHRRAGLPDVQGRWAQGLHARSQATRPSLSEQRHGLGRGVRRARRVPRARSRSRSRSAPRTSRRSVMGELKKYAGLYAEGGDFDIPSNWTVGLGIRPTDTIDIAIDVQQMCYSDVKSVANPMMPNLVQGAARHAGWRRVRMGEHDGGQGRASSTVPASGLTWRAGYAYGQQPIPTSEVMFNILAPGVIEQHATLRAQQGTVGKGRSFDVAVMRAFNKDRVGLESRSRRPARSRSTSPWTSGTFDVRLLR